MKWQRVNKRNRCQICDHYNWCMLAPDGSAALCMRIASDREKTLRDGSLAWLHRLDGKTTVTREYIPQTRAEVTLDVSAILRRYSMDTTVARRDDLAASLGVSTAALMALGAVWSQRRQAWAFPMYHDVEGFWEPCGIRLRSDTAKWTIKASHAGLFIPNPQHASPHLLVCEGITDTAAALDLGFAAIGRASCTGGAELVNAYIRDFKGEVVIVADADTPGRRGAAMLALDLKRMCKIIIPLKGKDLRQWKNQGAIAAVVQSAIRNTGYVQRRILEEQIRRWNADMRSSMVKKPIGTWRASIGSHSGVARS